MPKTRVAPTTAVVQWPVRRPAQPGVDGARELRRKVRLFRLGLDSWRDSAGFLGTDRFGRFLAR